MKLEWKDQAPSRWSECLSQVGLIIGNLTVTNSQLVVIADCKPEGNYANEIIGSLSTRCLYV